MALEEKIAADVRARLSAIGTISEVKMFGGRLHAERQYGRRRLQTRPAAACR
jgi:hypothetical protein